MTVAAESRRAGQSPITTWSELIGQLRPFIPTIPALAPTWLDQKILSSWFTGGKFSFLSTTINQQETAAPELEEQIVTKVASYGKQLGRLMEAVDVLAERAIKVGVDDDERKKLGQLTELAKNISDARERFATDNLDQILTSISHLGRDGHVDHKALQQIRALVDQLENKP